MTLIKKLAGDLALFIGFVSIILIIAASFGVLPKPVCDLLSWGSANFTLFIFLFCFCMGAYVALKITRGRRQN